MAEFTTEDIKGRTVIDDDGTKLGTVDDIVFDPDTWAVNGFLIALTDDVADDLDIKRGLFRGGGKLAITHARVKSIGENVLLNVDRHDIADLLRRGER